MDFESRLSPSFQKLSSLKRILNSHGIVAYPTETVFGIGCDPFDDDALNKIFEIKGRDLNKGVLILINNKSHVHEYVKELPNYAKEMIEKYWPGSVTFLFRAKEGLSPLLVGEKRLIGLRISNHPIASYLSSILQFGIVSTSANKSGETALMNAMDVKCEFGSLIDYIVEGNAGGKISSTVVDCSGEYPVLIRKGETSVPETERN